MAILFTFAMLGYFLSSLFVMIGGYVLLCYLVYVVALNDYHPDSY